jgi:hypothetical protein
LRYESNEEFFQAVRDLATGLELQGLGSAGSELRSGLACLNGLTDGWALLLESLERVKSDYGSELDPSQRQRLDEMVRSVRKLVYRR